MKKTIAVLAAVAALVLASCAKDAPADADAAKDGSKGASKADVSYAFGVAIGSSLKETGVELDYAKFLNGLKDVTEKDKPKVTNEEAQMTIQVAIMEAMQKVAEKNAAEEAKYFAENAKKAGVTTTASGLQYEVIKQGTGPKPIESDTVRVDYVGTFLDGKQFDSSIERGEPAVFPVAMVIPGWVEAIQLMPVGSKYKLYIPSSLAYGAEGSQGGIAPNTTLIFEVELLAIEPAAE